MYACGPLERIRCNLAVEKTVQLLQIEPDPNIRINLVEALLLQFAPEGIEEARNLLVGRQPDFHSRGLRNCLLETCKITGERFPEYDMWQSDREAE